jgi:hypothetical protein
MCSGHHRDSRALGVVRGEDVVTNGVLRRLASAFNTLEEYWGSVGVIHDPDALVETRITTIEGDVVGFVHDPSIPGSLMTFHGST